MINAISAGRVLKAGFVNFFRNLWLSTAATAVMLVTLIIVLTGVILNMTLSAEIDNIVKDVTVSVYFLPDHTEEQRNELRQALEGNSNVSEVSYLSESQALNLFTEENKDEPALLEGLSIAENALPASFEIELVDLSNIQPVIAIAESDKYAGFVEETSYDEKREQRIGRIATAQDFITQFSVIAGGIFAGISALIIFNTIRMAIFTRSEEIKIMKLIGATNGYIRGPFLFESMLYGVVAGSLALAAIYSAIASLATEIDRYISFSSTYDFFIENWLYVALATIGSGVLIGMVSSLLAITRYLKLSR